MSKTQHIAIGEIKTEGLQTRAAISMEVVRDYAEAEQERGAVLPPVIIYRDTAGAYWLADGFHRLAVARQNGRKKVECEVREGSRVDALRFALGANGAHGLRRTNADKANAVRVAYEHRIELGLGEVPSARAVAGVCGVSDTFVGDQLRSNRTWRQATDRVGADGKVYTLPPVPTRAPTENSEIDGSGEVVEGADGMPEASHASAHESAHDGAHEADGGAETRFGGASPSSGTGTGAESASGPAHAKRALPPVPVRPGRAAGPVDGRGKPIPPDLRPIWNRRAEVRELAGLVSRVRVALRKAQDGGDPLWAELNFSSAISNLDRAYTEIAAAEPWCVCPMCQGIGCKACKGRGLMGEFRYKTVPRELK